MRLNVAQKLHGALRVLSSPYKQTTKYENFVINIDENDKVYSLLTEVIYKRAISIPSNDFKDKWSYLKCKHSFDENNLYLTKITRSNNRKTYFLLSGDHTTSLEELAKVECKGYRVRMHLVDLTSNRTSDSSS